MKASSMRTKIVNLIRAIDDKFYEKSKRTKVLFVYTNSYGFSCQVPIIKALNKIDSIRLRITTDKEYELSESHFSNLEEYNIFKTAYTPYTKAVYSKWHLIIDTHVNSFYPKRNALHIGMHHGPAFGTISSKTTLVENYDIFFGLSEAERRHMERIQPEIFNQERVFFPVGFPKSDALVNNISPPEEIRARLQLKKQPTILITSHWETVSILRTFGHNVFETLCENFPDYNVVQTGHPWLWEGYQQAPGLNQQLANKLKSVEQRFDNAYFVPHENAEQLLLITDLLISDHSSILTTYSLLDKPIVWFKNPALAFAIDEICDIYQGASEVFSNISELPGRCRQALTEPNERGPGRQLMRETFFANPGTSGQKAAEILCEIGPTCSTKSPRWPLVMTASKKFNSTSQQ